MSKAFGGCSLTKRINERCPERIHGHQHKGRLDGFLQLLWYMRGVNPMGLRGGFPAFIC